MKFYRYESSENIGYWSEGFGQVYKDYEDEKDYLMADDPSGDETVRIVSIEIPDELVWGAEETSEVLEQATIIHDADRLDEDPRKDGYDFDFYAIWADDVKDETREQDE
ncbi:DNA-directed RNA polymerase subunit delta [Enterococcus sp. DIV0691]|uniref:DNA-directed RNA polymerase subunit delta n=1 Tax=Enterococcus sp. DIV0691 TaxID=2774703 RepID=UPI003F202803